MIMKTTEVLSINGRQAVALPEEFRFGADTVAIRKEGDRVIIEPIKGDAWPDDFFESIRVNDDAFARPDQGAVPSAPSLESK